MSSEDRSSLIEEERRNARLCVIDALEQAGWAIQLSEDVLILGDGVVRVRVQERRVLLVYAVMNTSGIENNDEINEINAGAAIAGFVLRFDTQGGPADSVCQRIVLPYPIPERTELGKWIEEQIVNVRSLAATLDSTLEG